MRKHVGLMALAAASALAFGGTYAKAASNGVPAVKLIVVDKGASGAKAVFVAKDASISKGTGTNTATIAVNFDFNYDNGVDAPSAGQFVLAEGSANWLVNKPTVGKYVNKSAPTGGGAKVGVIKPGNLVKLVGKNLGDTPIDILNQPGAAAGVANTAYTITDSGTGFDESYCSTFSACAWKSIAGGTGAKLVCKGGTADAGCAALAPPTSTTSTTLVPFLSFVTGPPTGVCGGVYSGGSGGTLRKALNCGGLNIGGGNSTVAEGPTPEGAETQLAITGGPVYTVSGRTAAQSGSNNNCSATGCQFGPWLPILSGGTSTCVQNTFASDASGTLDASTGDFDGAFPLNSDIFLTGNGSSPCPKCLGGTPGVTDSGNCDATWLAVTGNPYADSGAYCTPTNAAGDTYDCLPPPESNLGPILVELDPITTGTASFSDAGGLFCLGQATAGAFGCNGSLANPICPGGPYAGIDYMEELGSPAGPVTGTPADGTLASVFCIDATGNFLVDAAANLPGPGATTLPGSLTIVTP